MHWDLRIRRSHWSLNVVTDPTFALKPKRNAKITIIVFMVFFVVFLGAPGRRQLARKWFLRGICKTNNIQGSSLNEIFKILYKMCPLPKPTLLVYQNSRPVYMIIKRVQVEDLFDHLHQGKNLPM